MAQTPFNPSPAPPPVVVPVRPFRPFTQPVYVQPGRPFQPLVAYGLYGGPVQAAYHLDFPRRYDEYLRDQLPPEPEPVPPPPSPKPVYPGNVAVIFLEVPSDSVVLLGGEKQDGTGAERLIVSPPLDMVRTYKYQFVIRSPGRGERSLTVAIKAGDRTRVKLLN
jgi:hypothetical protein